MNNKIIFRLEFEAKDCPFKAKEKEFTERWEGIYYYPCSHPDRSDDMCSLGFNDFEYPDIGCPLIKNKNQISGPCCYDSLSDELQKKEESDEN